MAIKPTPKTLRLAKSTSILTNPALVAAVTTLVLIYRFASSTRDFWISSVISVALLIGPALLYSIHLWKKDGTVDLDLTNRQERVIPLMLACIGAGAEAYWVKSHFHNEKLVAIVVILIALLAVLTVVTTVWKISLHAAALSAVVTLLVVFRGDIFAFGYLILAPIVWAKLTLRQHTPFQLLGGTLVGVSLTLAAAWFFQL